MDYYLCTKSERAGQSTAFAIHSVLLCHVKEHTRMRPPHIGAARPFVVQNGNSTHFVRRFDQMVSNSTFQYLYAAARSSTTSNARPKKRKAREWNTHNAKVMNKLNQENEEKKTKIQLNWNQIAELRRTEMEKHIHFLLQLHFFRASAIRMFCFILVACVYGVVYVCQDSRLNTDLTDWIESSGSRVRCMCIQFYFIFSHTFELNSLVASGIGSN